MGVSTNAPAVARDLHRAGDTAQQRADRVTAHHGMLLTTRIKANASGRPGPNVITGDYRRSWQGRQSGSSYTVGTNKPQARRLEYGFYGPDALGRVYNQPPYPHLGPAWSATEGPYVAGLADVAADI